ncbi:hypothetical protein HYH39_06575 [Clostridium botulinum]|nr:hypothetical protein [Clostridium botulinum]MBY6851784.1 hypothetical protein [Clostridium botulinum]
MIVTEKEYQEMWKEFDGLIYTPLVNYIKEESIINGNNIIVCKYEILKTADEVYQEWLENKDKPPEKEPNEVEQLQKQLLETQAIVAELKYNKIIKENGGIQ